MGIKIDNLTGGYGQISVLKSVTFDVKDGEVVGLIGLNGAGKSTTINHIIGNLIPFSGSIKLNNISLEDKPALYKRQIAYIPEMPIFYDELTLKETLELTMLAYNLNRDNTWIKAHKLLKKFRLDNKLNWYPSDFSKGMQQKVMIVNAMITGAKVLIIDEPFIGLDPLAINDFLELIKEKKENGVSILMSTHVLSNAEKYCDRFVFMNKGKVIIEGDLKEIRNYASCENKSLNDIYLSLVGNNND